MEMWDLYDKNEVKTGLTITKRFSDIPAGYFHIVVETLVKHRDGTYLVMQRDFNKKESPGVYEGSAGGSILAGESKIDGAIREVLEETGLHVKHIEPTYYFINVAKGVINQGYLALVDDPSKLFINLEKRLIISGLRLRNSRRLLKPQPIMLITTGG